MVKKFFLVHTEDGWLKLNTLCVMLLGLQQVLVFVKPMKTAEHYTFLICHYQTSFTAKPGALTKLIRTGFLPQA